MEAENASKKQGLFTTPSADTDAIRKSILCAAEGKYG